MSQKNRFGGFWPADRLRKACCGRIDHRALGTSDIVIVVGTAAARRAALALLPHPPPRQGCSASSWRSTVRCRTPKCLPGGVWRRSKVLPVLPEMEVDDPLVLPSLVQPPCPTISLQTRLNLSPGRHHLERGGGACWSSHTTPPRSNPGVGGWGARGQKYLGAQPRLMAKARKVPTTRDRPPSLVLGGPSRAPRALPSPAFNQSKPASNLNAVFPLPKRMLPTNDGA